MKRRDDSDDGDLSVLFESLAPNEERVRAPKAGDRVLVTDKYGKWHEATIDGPWLADGAFVSPFVVSLTVEVEGTSHFVECVPHRDSRPETSYTYWRWPHEA